MTRAPDEPAELLLGDEAVARAALDARIAAAYSYPGTPATEIFEYVQAHRGTEVVAHWAANEKTAYEAALGVSMAGRRCLVSMKHVGLNVALDPFVNSALVEIGGGLVVAVGDDPGMHSSQNEQDSRWLADFARVVCLEPADPQQAYDMTREAFELSERFSIPVVVRLTTRLCHGRAAVTPSGRDELRPAAATPTAAGWALVPANARSRWRSLLERQAVFRAYSETAPYNRLVPGERELGVITAGHGRSSYLENVPELDEAPAHLHIGTYPIPERLVRTLAAMVDRILVLEDGYPFIETRLRGILESDIEVAGRLSGALPPDGELTPDAVRAALGLSMRPRPAPGLDVPPRPPQLCRGCPHDESFAALREVLAEHPAAVATADIGCYALGVAPPYEVLDSCVCMGASIGMAKGAADAGLWPVVAVIGDGTFMHSGLTPLMDAVAADTDMTVLILDNQTVAMTGLQPTVLPDSSIASIADGIGVDPDHLWVVELKPNRPEELASVLRKEIDHRGLSVVIAVRECVELAKQRRREELAP